MFCLTDKKTFKTLLGNLQLQSSPIACSDYIWIVTNNSRYLNTFGAIWKQHPTKKREDGSPVNFPQVVVEFMSMSRFIKLSTPCRDEGGQIDRQQWEYGRTVVIMPSILKARSDTRITFYKHMQNELNWGRAYYAGSLVWKDYIQIFFREILTKLNLHIHPYYESPVRLISQSELPFEIKTSQDVKRAYDLYKCDLVLSETQIADLVKNSMMLDLNTKHSEDLFIVKYVEPLKKHKERQ